MSLFERGESLRRLRRSRLVRATMPSGGQLFFCGHHANEHLPSWWALAHRSRTASFHERLILLLPQQRDVGVVGTEGPCRALAYPRNGRAGAS